MDLEKREIMATASNLGASEMDHESEVLNEAMVYMSLALDGELDATDRARFDYLLARYPAVQVEWQAWQALDMDFRSTPAVMPPPDFVSNFEVRLLQQERRRKLWLGSAFALLFTGTLTGAIVVALAFVSAIFYAQPGLPEGGARTLSTLWAMVGNWLDALATTLGVLLGTPQALGFGAAYVALTALILYAWTLFLRRTTRMDEAAHSV